MIYRQHCTAANITEKIHCSHRTTHCASIVKPTSLSETPLKLMCSWELSASERSTITCNQDGETHDTYWKDTLMIWWVFQWIWCCCWIGDFDCLLYSWFHHWARCELRCCMVSSVTPDIFILYLIALLLPLNQIKLNIHSQPISWNVCFGWYWMFDISPWYRFQWDCCGQCGLSCCLACLGW